YAPSDSSDSSPPDRLLGSSESTKSICINYPKNGGAPNVFFNDTLNKYTKASHEYKPRFWQQLVKEEEDVDGVSLAVALTLNPFPNKLKSESSSTNPAKEPSGSAPPEKKAGNLKPAQATKPSYRGRNSMMAGCVALAIG